ncbi:hypothetical protein [Streptomyces katrae]|uniref:hypothetical protein n=1 Tax=Streptomyces katrae TaxID=68223 RepID=UPI000A6F463C|nr:hypothetical protein [Streptomyces katrae]
MDRGLSNGEGPSNWDALRRVCTDWGHVAGFAYYALALFEKAVKVASSAADMWS